MYWVPALVSFAFISVISSFGPGSLEEAAGAVGRNEPHEVLFHLSQFAVFGLFAYRLLYFHLGWSYQYLAPLVILISAGYGILDEYHQSFVPGRDASVDDVVADVVGAVLAMVISGGLLLVRRHRSKVVAGSDY